MVDVLEGKLKLAKKLGADVVVEAAGSEASFNAASKMIKHNGKLRWFLDRR
ncbi:MAG: hypothetical protein K0R31_305 [Clostridiales bacterium]|nr:hypothetical protein [Clostridiales bacterium]